MEGRLQATRRRVRVAQTVLVAAAAAVFAGTAALARQHHPAHRKQTLTPLAAPPDLLRVVRRNQLAAGIVAPAEAPPGIGSAPS